ncbi:MAG: sulfatase [Xanthomonadales bacterium]|jgi:arylsulfatase A-like enzyme|nr:sulfatase [Xanthomonadales bacterium]
MRSSLGLLVAGCLLLCGYGYADTAPQGPESAPGNKPNILFIAVDDLNDWVGYTGVNPSTITPNIDALAERGTAFTNAFTQYPVCGPSRASLFAGLLPGTLGFTSQPRDPEVTEAAQELGTPLLHSYFAQNGYKTMAVGKLLHRHIPQGSVDESGGRGDWDRLEDGERLNWDTDRTMTDWGVYPYPEEEMSDPMAAGWAVERLREEHDRPFMLMVGFLRPHVPWYVPQRWFDAMGDAGELTLPPYKPDDLEDVPDYAVATNIAQGYPRTEWAIEAGQWNNIVHAYLASVHFVDHYVGQVLDALAKSPYAANTIVVLWSDHGYHLGEKNTFQKHSLWERSGKVPLVLAGPGVPKGETRNQAVGLIDIYPTLLDLAGLPENPVNAGHSLKPLLDDASMDWDNPVITQWRRNRDNWDRRGQAVQYGPWRYSLYGDGSEELYNHADDPNEWNNLAADTDAAARHRELMDKLKAFLPADYYTFTPR